MGWLLNTIWFFFRYEVLNSIRLLHNNQIAIKFNIDQKQVQFKEWPYDFESLMYF